MTELEILSLYLEISKEENKRLKECLRQNFLKYLNLEDVIEDNKNILVRNKYALGDSVVCMAFLTWYRKKYQAKVRYEGSYEDSILGYQNVYSLDELGKDYKIVDFSYDFNSRSHFCEHTFSKFGFSQRDLKGIFSIGDEIKEEKILLVQNENKCKQIPLDQICEILNDLKIEYEVCPTDLKISDYCEKILKSKFIFCGVSSALHLGYVYDKKILCFRGGREPSYFGVYSDVETMDTCSVCKESPCWKNECINYSYNSQLIKNKILNFLKRK